jgi:Ca2+/Na+ antiporter
MGVSIKKGDSTMKLSIFMITNAILAFAAGIILVFVPSLMINGFGITLDNSTRLVGQFYGSELILMGLVAWFARDIKDPKAARGVVGAFTIANLVSLVLAIIDMLNHTYNAIGWIAIAAYAVLSVVYGVYWVTRPVELRDVQPTQQMQQSQQTQHQPS